MCVSMVSLCEPVTMSGPSADAIQKGGTWIWDADEYNMMIKGMDPTAPLPVFASYFPSLCLNSFLKTGDNDSTYFVAFVVRIK